MKTVAIDFDGVIHKYSKGYQNGSIYDPPIFGAFDFIDSCLKEGYSLFIHSTRDSEQIYNWIKDWWPNTYEVVVIHDRVKFWNVKGKIGITNKKLPAHIYIDDRGFKFEGVYPTMEEIENFKTYQNK